MARARRKESPPAPSPPPPDRPVGRWLLHFVLPLLAAGALVAGVIWLSRLARDDLRKNEPLAFANIDCLAPPGMTRAEFLEETRLLAALPERLDVDGTTADRVRLALAAHPWVRHVSEVRVTPKGVSADVEFRAAVLWVESAARAADGDGALLPVSATRDGLAVLTGRGRAPKDRAGQPWGDPDVEASAQVVALIRREGVSGRIGVEARGGEVTIMRDKTRFVWGRAPGREKAGEQDVGAKLRKLREALKGG